MDRPLFYSDERVDLLDFVRALLYGQVEATRNLRALLVPEADPRGYVFEGFAITPNGIGNGVLITFGADGRMLLGENRDGTIFNGHIAEDETGALTVELLCADFTPPAGIGWYDLYIRLILDPGTGENRAFWSSVLGSEYLALVDTSDRPTFALAAVTHGAAAPWAEGVKIAEINNAVPGFIALGEINPLRRFFFEGEEDVFYHPSWGDGANDRNANRALHGVHDLYTFSEFVRRQLMDIMGHDLDAFLFPWTAVHSYLPSLSSLKVEHTYSGHAWGSHHYAIEMHGAASANVKLSFVPHDASPTLAIQQGNGYLDFCRPAGGSPALRMLLSGIGLDGGLSISGPHGPAADMLAGDAAYLLFGKADLATMEDFRIKTSGGAGFAARLVEFIARSPGTTAFSITGAGDITSLNDVFSGARYKHTAAEVFTLTIPGESFVPIGAAVAYPLIAASIAAPTASIAQLVYGFTTGATPELGIAFDQTATGDLAGHVLSADRLAAPLTCLPNFTFLLGGGPCNLECEATAAFLAAANQRIEFGIIARRRIAAPGAPAYYVVAIVRFLPTVAPGTKASVWVNGPDIAAHGSVFDHSVYSYSLIAQVYDGGALGVAAGAAAGYGLSLPLTYTTFHH
jgi:hypothetical protein